MPRTRLDITMDSLSILYSEVFGELSVEELAA
jgi:hypothetical protein